MAFRTGLQNFSKGELAPELQARVDVAAYNAGVLRGENVVILKYGGLTKRPGTLFVERVREPDLTNPVRLLSFQFDEGKNGQNYVLELGQAYMRLAARAGLVLEDELAITSATRANPVVIGAALHGYAVGDDVFVDGVVGMTELNGRLWRVVSIPDTNHFAIQADGTGWGTFTSATGGITRVSAPAAPPSAPAVPAPVAPAPTPVVGGGGGGRGIRHASQL